MPGSDAPRLLAFAHGTAVLVLLLFVLREPPSAQDFLPLYTAATLVADGDAAAVYPPAGAGSLFDVAPAFLERARAIDPATPPEQVTAFVSSPLALLLVTPLTGLAYGHALVLWRALMLLALFAAAGLLLRFGRERPNLWILVLLGTLPLAFACLGPGQSSPLLLLAIASSLRAPTAGTTLATAALLSLVIALKVFPLAFLLFPLLLGEWRLPLATLTLLALAAGASLLAFPPELAGDFLRSLGELRAQVIPDWNNASLDAGIARLTSGAASSAFVTLPPALRGLSVAAKGAFLLATAWLVWRRRDVRREARLGAGWLAIFAALPLVWPHYLVVAAAFAALPIAFRSAGWARVAVATAIGCALPILLRINGVRSAPLLGALGSAIWLTTVAVGWAATWFGAEETPEAGDGGAAADTLPPCASVGASSPSSS